MVFFKRIGQRRISGWGQNGGATTTAVVHGGGSWEPDLPLSGHHVWGAMG